MVEFTAAQSDVEMGMLPGRVVLVEKRSSSGRMWTMIGVLFLLVLCFGGALLFVWHLNGKEEATVRRNDKSPPTLGHGLLGGRLPLWILILTSAPLLLLSQPQAGRLEALVNAMPSSASSDTTGECACTANLPNDYMTRYRCCNDFI